MKKFFSVLTAILLFTTFSFAQTQTASPKAKEPATKQSSVTKTKKDGTPDMRYKDNKVSAKKHTPAGHAKKDGTPDMRYSANKKTATTNGQPAPATAPKKSKPRTKPDTGAKKTD